MENSTELVFILDRSGSMAGLEADTIGGYNAMLEKQRAVPGEARVTTVLFDNQYELLHDRIDLRAVAPITEKEYFVRGSTALLDAVGSTIEKIGNAQKRTAKPYRADKVIFIIITDGMENASHTFDYTKVKAMVECQKQEFGWEFIFLGANIDAVEVAGRFGVAPNRAQSYHADGAGTRLNYDVVSDAVASVRCSAPLDAHWKDAIEEDFQRRGGSQRR